MIRPEAKALFLRLDRIATGSTLQTQTEAASLLIFQATVTAARANGIDRRVVLSEVLGAVGQFIAACEIIERNGEETQHEAAQNVAGTLIRKYTAPR